MEGPGADLVGDVGRRHVGLPGVDQLAEGGVRSGGRLFAQPAQVGQLGVGQAHVLLVGLHRAAFLQRLQFGRRRRRQHRVQRRQSEPFRQGKPSQTTRNPPKKNHRGVLGARVDQEALQVRLGDAADGVDVGAGTVVLGQVAAQRFVHVGRAEDEQAARAAARPQHQLRQQVRQHLRWPGPKNKNPTTRYQPGRTRSNLVQLWLRVSATRPNPVETQNTHQFTTNPVEPDRTWLNLGFESQQPG